MLLVRWWDKLENNETSNPVTVNPAENEVQIREQHSVLTQQSVRISPLPPPEDFAKYKEVMPDLPERIVKQFEEDSSVTRELKKERQKATIELQKSAQEADFAFDKRSQWMAFGLIALGLIGTILLAYLDKDAASLATAIGTVFLIFKGTFSKNSPPNDSNGNSENN